MTAPRCDIFGLSAAAQRKREEERAAAVQQREEEDEAAHGWLEARGFPVPPPRPSSAPAAADAEGEGEDGGAVLLSTLDVAAPPANSPEPASGGLPSFFGS